MTDETLVVNSKEVRHSTTTQPSSSQTQSVFEWRIGAAVGYGTSHSNATSSYQCGYWTGLFGPFSARGKPGSFGLSMIANMAYRQRFYDNMYTSYGSSFKNATDYKDPINNPTESVTWQIMASGSSANGKWGSPVLAEWWDSYCLPILYIPVEVSEVWAPMGPSVTDTTHSYKNFQPITDDQEIKFYYAYNASGNDNTRKWWSSSTCTSIEVHDYITSFTHSTYDNNYVTNGWITPGATPIGSEYFYNLPDQFVELPYGYREAISWEKGYLRVYAKWHTPQIKSKKLMICGNYSSIYDDHNMRPRKNDTLFEHAIDISSRTNDWVLFFDSKATSINLENGTVGFALTIEKDELTPSDKPMDFTKEWLGLFGVDLKYEIYDNTGELIKTVEFWKNGVYSDS